MGPPAKWPRHCWFCWRRKLTGWPAGVRGEAVNEKWAAIIKKKVKWQEEGRESRWKEKNESRWVREDYIHINVMTKSTWIIVSICLQRRFGTITPLQRSKLKPVLTDLSVSVLDITNGLGCKSLQPGRYIYIYIYITWLHLLNQLIHVFINITVI